MKQITYAQRLHGRLFAVGPGLVDVELVTAGATPLGAAARLLSQLEFCDERSFREEGTIEYEGVDALRVSTLDRGVLSPAPRDGMRHGTAVLEVEGVGGLAGARGRITSNFVVSNGGDITDDQVVVLFVAGEEE